MMLGIAYAASIGGLGTLIGTPPNAILAGVTLFIIPSITKRGTGLLDWDTAKKLPWGVLLLFGGVWQFKRIY